MSICCAYYTSHCGISWNEVFSKVRNNRTGIQRRTRQCILGVWGNSPRRAERSLYVCVPSEGGGRVRKPSGWGEGRRARNSGTSTVFLLRPKKTSLTDTHSFPKRLEKETFCGHSFDSWKWKSFQHLQWIPNSSPTKSQELVEKNTSSWNLSNQLYYKVTESQKGKEW